MMPRSRYRPIICLSAVLLIHWVIYAALNSKHPLTEQVSPTVSTLWIIPEVSLHKFIEQSKSVTFKIPSRATKSSTITLSSPEPEKFPAPTANTTARQPHLDLNALRAEAVQQEITREKTPIELANESRLKDHGFESQVAKGMDKARRSDCRTSYFDAGLFAPLIIAADLLRDKGCKF